MIEIFRKCKICKEIKYLQDFGNASIKNGKQYYRWKCKKCGDVVSSDTQPFCKTCAHIERIDVKMEKMEK